MNKMPWSRMYNTPLGIALLAYYDEPHRYYHNRHHIKTGFEHAQLQGFEYDPNLDLAWLSHDLIYDHLPHKEIRSIDLLRAIVGLYPDHGANMDIVAAMIEATIDHIANDTRIIRMDLGDLAYMDRVHKNHALIRKENMEIYGISEHEVAFGNKLFMTGLEERVSRMAANSIGIWDDIILGIKQSIIISENIING